MNKLTAILAAVLLLVCEAYTMGSKSDQAARNSTEPGYADTSTTGSTDTNVGRDLSTGSTAGTVPTNADTNKNPAMNPATAKPDEYDTAMGRKKTPGEKQMSRRASASGTTKPKDTY